MKRKYDKPLLKMVDVCQANVLIASGEPLNFNKDWLSVLGEEED